MATPMESFIQEMKDFLQPDKVYIMDGSQEEAEKLTKLAEKEEINGTTLLKELNGKTYPNSYYHRSNTNDVARVEHLTFVCTPEKEEAGPNKIGRAHV